MKYTYQDSTELPNQRDFVQDLRDFIKVAKKVLPLENSAIEMSDEEKSEVVSLENRLNNLNKFETDIKIFIENASKDADAKEILECRNMIIDVCIASAAKNRETLKSELDRSQKVYTREVSRMESSILSMLSPIFENGIYGAEKKYSALMNNDVLHGSLTASIAGMDYEFDLVFMNDSLTVKNIFRQLSLPKWGKGGLLQKENKIKFVDVSDFIITSINYDSSMNLALGYNFENKKSGRKFRITCDEHKCHVYDGDQSITGDDTLFNLMNMDDISEFATEVKTYVQEHIKSQMLTRILIDGKDATRNNEAFDCLKIIAEQYGDIISECLERGYVKSEITIKIEQADGTRTEKYVTKEEVFNLLSEIGSEGLELAGILGVEE
ncbi:MAG TPA: hypothetical protein C5S50_03470 [Methanosarcinaceae archaeon]|nr:hypothetical protein [Methanosarcinaceae archaeon]